MSNRFGELIRKLEIEVTNLKTAHEHGLGTVDFYSKTAQGTFSPTQASGLYYLDYRVTATVADGELLPAFAELETNKVGSQPVTTVSVSISGRTIVWNKTAILANGDDISIQVRVISAAKLSSLILEKTSA